jgi:DNA-binding MarR family transcriptional regulator
METTSAVVDAAATSVRRSVARFARRLRAQRAEHGLSLSKMSALGALHRLGPMTATALAAHERIRPQSQTRMLAELLKSGLISRERDPKDARASFLLLSAKGKDFLRGEMHGRDTWLAAAMRSTLTAGELELLLDACRLFDRLAAYSEAATVGEVSSRLRPARRARKAKRQ